MSAPRKQFKQEARSLPLRRVLGNYDPTKWSDSTEEYRKPEHQRINPKNTKWKQELVESILKGRSVDSILLSPHRDDNGEDFYNIQNGQTRLTALYEFYNDQFPLDTQYYGGKKFTDLSNTDTDRFKDYELTACVLKKASGWTDEQYDHNLIENFIILNERTGMDDSDQYWAQKGHSELVDTCFLMYERYRLNIQKFICKTGLNHNEPKGRKPLSQIVGIISGCMFGYQMANGSYLKHHNVLFIRDHQELNIKKCICRKKLDKIFETMEAAYLEEPAEKSERICRWKNIPSLIGLMIADYDIEEKMDSGACYSYSEKMSRFRRRWIAYMNDCRSDKKFAETTLFNEISSNARALSENLIYLRMLVVREHYNAFIS